MGFRRRGWDGGVWVVADWVAKVQEVCCSPCSLSLSLRLVGCVLTLFDSEIHGPWDPARPVIRRQWE